MLIITKILYLINNQISLATSLIKEFNSMAYAPFQRGELVIKLLKNYQN